MSGFSVLHGERWEVAVADVRAGLAQLPDASVHTVVTSPPYWALRDYGVDGQIGLESSPFVWIDEMVGVMREVWRVLRDDGTVWLNVGDAFARDTAGYRGGHGVRSVLQGRYDHSPRAPRRSGFKDKDLMLLPHRLAIALQEDGWYVRMDIVWSKPNPMPESIKDRPSKSHEYVFLLSKRPRYFYDGEAIREPYNPASIARRKYQDVDVGARKTAHQPGGSPTRRPPDVRDVYDCNPAGRTRRSVWEVNVEPFADGHFATFPTALVEPCILAGTSAKGVCPECGAPWKRIITKGAQDLEHARACGADANGEYNGKATKEYEAGRAQDPSAVKARILEGMRERRTTGWMPTCGCSPRRPVLEKIAELARDSFAAGWGSGPWFFDNAALGWRPEWSLENEPTIPLAYDGEPLCCDPACGHPHAPGAKRSGVRHSGACGRCRCSVFRWGDPHVPVPATVLDPFAGAFTTLLVAVQLGRRALGVELNPKYAEIGAKRLRDDQLSRDFGGHVPKTDREKNAMASQLKLFGGV